MLNRTSLIDTEWDAWDRFYITMSPAGHIQMADATLDASGDSFQAFDKQNTLSTRTERGIAYLDKALIAMRVYGRKRYIKKEKKGLPYREPRSLKHSPRHAYYLSKPEPME
jgi:hypothetical protein